MKRNLIFHEIKTRTKYFPVSSPMKVPCMLTHLCKTCTCNSGLQFWHWHSSCTKWDWWGCWGFYWLGWVSHLLLKAERMNPGGRYKNYSWKLLMFCSMVSQSVLLCQIKNNFISGYRILCQAEIFKETSAFLTTIFRRTQDCEFIKRIIL